MTETENGYLYTMTPSGEWLDDPQRVYPVTIDPHIEKITSYANVKDTTVSFKTRDATVGASSLESSAEIAYLKVGRQYNGNELGAAVYFSGPLQHSQVRQDRAGQNGMLAAIAAAFPPVPAIPRLTLTESPAIGM